MLAARDLVTNDIEVAVEGAQLDGMLCLSSCDKTVPGQLMAAARLDVPTIVVPCGYQASGEFNGRHCDIEDVFIGAMHVATGAMDTETLVGMTGRRSARPVSARAWARRTRCTSSAKRSAWPCRAARRWQR